MKRGKDIAKKTSKDYAAKVKVWFLALFVLSILAILAINVYMVTSTRDKVITLESISDQNADCILILGAGVWGNRPSPMLEDRLIFGIELYNAGVSKRILMSGDHGREEYDEVNIMKGYAIGNGIPSNHIFMDHAGFDTYSSVYRSKHIFQADSIIIITQRYHLYRALYIARSLGIHAIGVSSDPRQYAGQKMRDFREVLARTKDFVNVILKPKPKYLGDVIPVSGNGDITNDR